MKVITQKFILLISFFFPVMLLCNLKDPFQDINNVKLEIEVLKKNNRFNYCVNDEVKFKVTVYLPHLVKNVSIFFGENGNKDDREITTDELSNEVIFFDYTYKKKGLKKVIFTITFRGSSEKRDEEFKIEIGVAPTIRNEKNIIARSNITLGKPLTLTADHEEYGKASYLWFKNSKLLAGKDKQSLIFNPLKESDTGQYYCIVSTDWGKDRSKPFDLSFKKDIIAPVIKKHPQSQEVKEGDIVLFSIESDGPNLKYQWQKDGSNIGNATKGEYKFTASSRDDRAGFRCVVNNDAGEVKSNTAELTVLYKVIYNKRDGTGSYEKYYASGHEIDLPKLTRKGYLLKGWSDGSTSYGTKYTMMTKSVIFNAIWEEKRYLKVAAGGRYSMFLKTDGTLWACGKTKYDRFGDSTTDRRVPVQVMDNILDMSPGGDHSLILKTDNSLWACGRNKDGQLGDGTSIDRYDPVKIMSDVQSMSAGSYHSLILKKNGTLWACGQNMYGQLGIGNTINHNKPVKVMQSVQDIAAGWRYSLILRTDGTLLACGQNRYGQLGVEDTIDRSTPVEVMSGVLRISAGARHSLILKNDSSLWTWGNNINGQLGIGDTINRSTPVQVMSDVQSISAGFHHSLSLNKNGFLWSWGKNDNGRLGDGSTTDRSIPKQVMSDVQNMSAGGGHNLILRTDGTLWAWGKNYDGQLGDGTTTHRSEPVLIKF